MYRVIPWTGKVLFLYSESCVFFFHYWERQWLEVIVRGIVFQKLDIIIYYYLKDVVLFVLILCLIN